MLAFHLPTTVDKEPEKPGLLQTLGPVFTSEMLKVKSSFVLKLDLEVLNYEYRFLIK